MSHIATYNFEQALSMKVHMFSRSLQKLMNILHQAKTTSNKLSNNLPNYDANYISLLFYIAFLFFKGLYFMLFLLFNIPLGVLVWLYSCVYSIYSLVVMLK